MKTGKKKLADIVGSLDYEELIDLQRDLLSGGAGVKQIVTSKLREIHAAQSRTCGNCGNTINLRMAEEFTLILGNQDVRKRVSFCALDCLEYFAAGLKQMTAKRVENSS